VAARGITPLSGSAECLLGRGAELSTMEGMETMMVEVWAWSGGGADFDELADVDPVFEAAGCA